MQQCNGCRHDARDSHVETVARKGERLSRNFEQALFGRISRARETVGGQIGSRMDSDIRNLAIIGDRRTAAILDRNGNILWYCPGRFDHPAVFAALLDSAAGAWSVHVPNAEPGKRRYLGSSGVLETRLGTAAGDLIITDWMPVGRDVPKGAICRRFSAAPQETRIELKPRPDYGRREAKPVLSGAAVTLDAGAHFLHASHPMEVKGDTVCFSVPKGEPGWAVLSDRALAAPGSIDLDRWLDATLEHWRSLAEMTSYSGPYEREVAASLRTIRLLCHEDTGGIVAAATTSLPEVAGGASNWDYRYVWLRDAGMIVSALTRLGGRLTEGERYLDFICGSRGSSSSYPLAVFTTLDGELAPEETILDHLAGYRGSRPVRIGNGARDQMQIDAFANVLLAAKLIYRRSDQRPHWDAVEEIAEFLVRHWQEPDHGIWEEKPRRQYTASKVIAACALASAAEFSTDDAQVERWQTAVQDIRAFVAENCLTREGAYAAVAGGEDVDVSAALFPVWAYTDAGTPEMLATIAALEKNWSWEGLLYWRRLECAGSHEEGAFLAGTFWVAQYWVMRGNLERARRIIDAALEYSNDVGLFAEEAEPRNGRMVGNIPQSFVHAAFIGAVIDLKAAGDGPRTAEVAHQPKIERQEK
jgi:GH15 family glucan-1,4-alpha-glucosidase